MRYLFALWAMVLIVAFGIAHADRGVWRYDTLEITIPAGAKTNTGSVEIPGISPYAYTCAGAIIFTSTWDNYFTVKYAPSDVIDSYLYCCTIITGATPPDTLIVQDTTALQAILMAIRPTTADSTKFDTTDGDINCSTVFEATTLGFIFDPSSMGSELVTELVDSLVDSINAVMGDSVTATESGTGILITSDHSEDVLTDIFTISCSDSLNDTTYIRDSLAGVLDHMVAAINADGTIDFIAYDSGTFMTIANDDSGEAFTVGADSSVDTTVLARTGTLGLQDTLFAQFDGYAITSNMEIDTIKSVEPDWPDTMEVLALDSIIGFDVFKIDYRWSDTAVVDPYHDATGLIILRLFLMQKDVR